MINKVNQQI